VDILTTFGECKLKPQEY